MTGNRLDPEVLGRLLLVQQTVDVLPDPGGIAAFLGNALQAVPGLGDLSLCLDGRLYPDREPYRCLCSPRCAQASGQLARIPEGWCLDGTAYCLPLRTARGRFGCLLLAVDDQAAFEPYSGFLANTANQVATAFEMRDYLQRLDASRTELETRIEQRTRQLQERNEALEREIAHRRHLEAALAESEEKFREICTNARDAIVIADDLDRAIFWNPAAERIFQYRAEEVLGRNIHQLLAPANEQDSILRGIAQFRSTGSGPIINTTRELQATRRDGVQIPIELSVSPMRLQGRLHTIGIVRDITERKHADDELRRVNRALQVLSACNQELIHSDDEPALFSAVCRVLVNVGAYRMAWVGLAEQNPRRTVRPVAQMGAEDDYLETADISWDDTERGRGPTGTAIRSGTIQVNQNVSVNPNMAPWRTDALERGYQSSIALPLNDGGRTFGALTIYASEADAFDAEEVNLMGELANDLSFGILTLRAREQQRQAEEMVARLAYFDTLTGLPNRVRFSERLQQAVKEAQNGGFGLAVLTLDVDRFNDIQSGLGVQQADEVLKQIAFRLQHTTDRQYLLARMGGDIFAVLIPHADAVAARALAAKIEQTFREPFQQAGVSLDVQITMGAALFPEHGSDPNALLLRSNIASREARTQSADYALYSGSTDAESPHRLALIAELRRAIQEHQLILHYQPKIDLKAGQVSGAEALVRWQHPEKGLIPPADFIPLAEHTGLIKPLTYWVIEAAFRQSADWAERGFRIPVAVNVSPSNLRDPEFLQRVLEMHNMHGVEPELLQVEITETALMEDPMHSQQVLNQLKELGMKIFVDDFGTGYSSLAYIATLPIHALKVDRSFVTRMPDNSQVRSVVEAAVSLARKLNLRTVAEGVDSKAQVDELIRVGCDEIQGFFFGRPMPADQFEAWTSAFSIAAYGLTPAGMS